MKISNRYYCSHCKQIDVPLVKNSKNKYGYQYYLCRACVLLKTKKYREANRSVVKMIRQRSLNKFPEKQEARIKLNIAVKAGKIRKAYRCEVCFKKVKLQAHHEDYDKALEVLWLCTNCHALRHQLVLQ